MQLLLLKTRAPYRQALIRTVKALARSRDEQPAVISEYANIEEGVNERTFEACIFPLVPQDDATLHRWAHLESAGYTVSYMFHVEVERAACARTAAVDTPSVARQRVPYICQTRFGTHKRILSMLMRIDPQVVEMMPAGNDSSHERYRKLLNRTSEGFWDVGPDLQIAYANAAFKSISQEPQPVGKNLLDFFEDTDRARLRSILENQQEGIIIPFTMRLKSRGKGVGKIIQIDPSPRFGWNGQYLGGWALIRDITDQSDDMEQTLRQERELYTLYTIASTLSRGFQLKDLVLAATTCIREQLAVDATCTWIRADGAEGMRTIEPRGLQDAPLQPALVEAALCWCQETPTSLPAVVVRDTAKSRNRLAHIMGDMGFRSIAAIPLLAGSERIGFLWLACHDPSIMTRNWVSLLISIGHQLALAIVNALGIEEKLREEMRQKQFYRDAVCAITNGKLSLMDRAELAAVRSGGHALGGMDICCREDVYNARKLAETILAEQKFTGERIFDIATCVTEAATNTLLHGGGGKMSVTTIPELPAVALPPVRSDGIRIVLEDHGSGINFSELPHAILKRGYSTAVSMGLGYTLILDMMDRVYLATDASGTIILMEAAVNPVNAELEAWLAKVD